MLLNSNLEQRKMPMRAQKSKEISCEGNKYIWNSSTCTCENAHALKVQDSIHPM